MSLNVALSSAVRSLLTVEQEMNVASNNISNASTAGYTAKTAETTASYTDGIGTGVSVTAITSSVNRYLAAQINTATSASNAADTFETYYESLEQALGSLTSDTSGTDISSSLSTLQSDLTALSDSPDSTSAKSQVVSDLSSLTATLRTTSSQVQALRQQADGEISDTVDDVNTQLDTISKLNSAITVAQASGQSTADLEDQRTTALQALSADIGITSYVDGNDQLQIYTSGGQALLTGTQVNHLSHTAAAAISPATTYPGSIDGIMVGGTDITSSITSGKLSALIQQRDTVLPNVESELDTLASSLSTTLNGIYGQGTSSPPPQSLTGTTSVALTDPVTVASGTTVRIAVTDSSGDFAGYADIDLTGDATVNDIVNSIDAGLANAGVNATASLNSNGQLVVSANSSSDGVAISTLSGSVGGTNLSAYFGLNSLLTGGSSAATIAVNSTLASSPDLLATGALNDPTTATVAVAAGDSTIATQLADAMSDSQSFAAAGFLGSTSSTFASYAASLIGDVATRYQAASGASTTADSMLSQLQTTFGDESGVNVDEQTANLTTLQNLYSASAQVISTVKTMYQTLLAAIQ